MLGVRLFVAVVVGVSVSLVVSLVGVGSVPVSAVGVIGPGGRRCFEVVGSPGDAAVVNLTPVLAQGSGNGLLVSSDVVSPPVAANVNYRVGSVDPNVAIVPIGADGEVCYVNARRTGVHLVADHLGTIAATVYRTATSTGGPERVADTRSGGGMVGPGGRRCFEVVGSPGDAAVVNLTPVLAQGSGNGLLVSSDVVSPPVAANVNYRVGSVDPNVAIVPIGADGEVCYVNARRTGVHLVADHLGTIAATVYRTATSTGGPERVADTRSGGGMVGPGGRRCFEVVGSPGDAAVVNLTPVLAQGSGNGLLVSSDVVSPPVAANVNYRVGSVDPNVAIVPIGADGEVCYVNARRTGVHLVADHLGTIAATVYRTATSTGAPQRVTDTRPPLDPVAPCRLPEAAYVGVGIGFPRSADRMRSIGTIRATVLFADFSDVPASTTPEQTFEILSPTASDFFDAVSYGSMDLVLEPHPVWLRMSEPSTTYAAAITQFDEHRDWLQEAIDLADADIDFSDTDVVVVIATPDATAIGYGPTFTGYDGPGGRLTADGVGITNGITSGADLTYWGGLWLNHELGHSMTLADLYSYVAPTGFTRPFSMMDDIGGAAPEYFAYERWLLGWIEDAQIACLPASEQLLLSPVERAGGTKAAMVPVGATRSVVVESRRALGWDAGLTREGAVVYVVDTSVRSGFGPIEVMNGRRALGEGDSVTVEGVTITVVDADASGDTVQVTLG